MRRHVLARRLILHTALFSAALAIITSAVQLAWEYRRDVHAIERMFASVERGHLPSVVESAWLIDREQLQILVGGIRQLPDLDYAEVRIGEERIAASGQIVGSGIERRWPLVRRYRDREVGIGELAVRASLTGPRAASIERVAVVTLLNAAGIAIIAVFLFLLMRTTVTRHLEEIADYVGGADPRHLEPSLALQRAAPPEADELDGLVDALNRLASDVRGAHDQLRLSATVFEQAVEGIVICDAQARIVAVNRRFCETTGYAEAEALGQTPRLLQSGRQDAAFYAAMWRQLSEQGSWSGELWNRRKDGSEYPEYLSISAVRNGDGALTNYIGMYYDLSERYAAQRALQESEGNLRLVMDHVPAMITYYDGDLRYRFANRRFQEVFGMSDQALYGLSLREFLGNEEFGHVERHFLAALAGRPAMFEEARRIASGEMRHFRVYIVPRTEAQERVRGCYALSIDVTSETQSREEMERLVAERTASLAAANRELEAFSYTVSHDLRSPLRHIAGFLGMLGEVRAVAADARAAELIARAGTAARRLGEMIDQLLTFARLGRQPLHPVRVDLRTMVEALREQASSALGARRVEWRIGALPVVRADPTLLRFALQNLIDNAVKYSRGRDPARIEVSAEATAGRVTLCVRDNGAGFDMQYAGKLFGVFERLHSSADFPGTGIGLAHVKRIAERHGGTVRAEAEPGRGAAFYLTLPGPA